MSTIFEKSSDSNFDAFALVLFGKYQRMLEISDILKNRYPDIFDLSEDSLEVILIENVNELHKDLNDFIDERFSVGNRAGFCMCLDVPNTDAFNNCARLIEIEHKQCLSSCSDGFFNTLFGFISGGTAAGSATIVGTFPGFAAGVSVGLVSGIYRFSACTQRCENAFALECRDCMSKC